MALFITQCPHCMTSFRTSITQLQSAEGMVRCGACLKIFVADDNLVPSPDLRTVVLPPPEPDERQLSLEDAADADELDEPPAADNIFTLDLADSLPNRRDPSISEQEPIWELLEDETAATLSDAVSPGESPPRADNPAIDDSTAEGSSRQELRTPDHSVEDDEFPEFGAAEFHSREFEDVPGSTPRTQFTPENLAAAREISAPLELQWHEPVGRGRRFVLSGLLALLLTAGLLAQFIWYNLEELSQNSSVRPWLERLCTAAGCSLQPLVDIRSISSDNLVVRSHTEIANALSVNLVFRNNAPYAQPFPALHLRFTDVNNAVVAERRFTPAEYLPPEIVEMRMMPPGAPVQVALEVLDPGSDAINYEVSFSPMFSLARP